MVQPALLPPVALPDLDPRFLARHGIVPLGVEDGRLVVAMADPDDRATIAALGFAARREIVVRAGAVARPVAPSLFGRIGAAFGGAAVAQWVRIDTLARLVADGATPAAALARIRDAGEAVPTIAWAGPVAGLDDLTAVAAQVRAELELAVAVRSAVLAPCAVLVLAMLVIGWWGLAPAIALIGFRGMPAVLATARRTGRAMALGTAVDPAGLTLAERDRVDAAAVQDRARLMIGSAAGRVTAAMLLMLAILAVVRLG